MQDGIKMIIVDNTNIQVAHMKPYIAYAATNFYEIYILEPDTNWRYNASQCSKKNTHRIEAAKITRVLDDLMREGKPPLASLIGKRAQIVLTGHIFEEKSPQKANSIKSGSSGTSSLLQPFAGLSLAASTSAPSTPTSLPAPATEQIESTSSSSSADQSSSSLEPTTSDESSSDSVYKSANVSLSMPVEQKPPPGFPSKSDIHPAFSVLFPKPKKESPPPIATQTTQDLVEKLAFSQHANLKRPAKVLSLSLNTMFAEKDNNRDFQDVGCQANEAIILLTTACGLEVPVDVSIGEICRGEKSRKEVIESPPGLELPKKGTQTEFDEMLPAELLKRIFYMEPLEHIDHLLSFLQLEDAVRLLAECNHYVNFDTNAEFLEYYDDCPNFDENFEPFEFSDKANSAGEVTVFGNQANESKVVPVPKAQNPTLEVDLGEALCKTLAALFGDGDLVEKEDEKKTKAVIPLNMLKELYNFWQSDGFEYNHDEEFPDIFREDTSNDEEMAKRLQREEELAYMSENLSAADKIKLKRLHDKFKGVNKTLIEEIFRGTGMMEDLTAQTLSEFAQQSDITTTTTTSASGSDDSQNWVEVRNNKGSASSRTKASTALKLKKAQEKALKMMDDMIALEAKMKEEQAKASKYPSFGPMANARVVPTQNAQKYKRQREEIRYKADRMLLEANRESEHLDLHFMTQSAAMHAVKERLGKMRNVGCMRQLRIITGQGNNSINGQPLIRSNVERYLTKNGYLFTRTNPGELMVQSARNRQLKRFRSSSTETPKSLDSTIGMAAKTKEDSWAWVVLGDSFPDKPVKVHTEQNQYVALWYKHGKPIHGRSWNDGGIVQCSFPYNKAELKTKEQLEGKIQVLQYVGDHNTVGFWYNWIKYSERLENDLKSRQMVFCGDSFPIFWTEKSVLGYVDNKTEIARFSMDGQVVEKKGGELNNMLIIVRELKGGPPNCGCATCLTKPRTAPRVTLNQWMDFRAGDPFPSDVPLIQAMDKDLDTLPGENSKQYVALWYMQGEPVMGRVWNENGRIAANFSWNGNEYRGSVGSIQILAKLNEHVAAFEYGWIAYPEAANFGDKTWIPLHVDNGKVFISSGVITHQGKQVLGKVDIRNEKNGFGYGGKEVVAVGPAVHPTMVLCRKPKPGCKLD
ncbi:hypothetical protein WR25_23221 [Diploscapter pachys]|uniref:Smr domain-containing protein n=1 Tax=Diploscapter pachys TaxID=2018661 RepID=A0A2A2JJS9_9BILA|nr:hypothetical protein WR25_23221 [Diploscapter pachys]